MQTTTERHHAPDHAQYSDSGVSARGWRPHSSDRPTTPAPAGHDTTCVPVTLPGTGLYAAQRREIGRMIALGVELGAVLDEGSL